MSAKSHNVTSYTTAILTRTSEPQHHENQDCSSYSADNINLFSRGELSYLAPLGSENISAPYLKQCFFQRGVLPPRLSQTPRLPVPRQK